MIVCGRSFSSFGSGIGVVVSLVLLLLLMLLCEEEVKRFDVDDELLADNSILAWIIVNW